MSNAQIVRERVPYVKTIESTVAIFKSILAQFRNVSKIVVDFRLPYVLVERMASPEEAAVAAATSEAAKVYEMTRERLSFQEYVPEEGLSPTAQLFEMFARIADEEMVVSHILVGSIERLRSWVKFPRRHTMLLGVPVYQLEQIPNDVILVCGSVRHDADAEDVQFALKGSIP